LICQHPDRESIDKALARQTSNRELARVYSLSEASIRRHKANHLPARVARAQEAEDVREALDVVRQLKAINAASLHILKEAREQGKQGTALAAIDRIHKQIELQAKLLGELDDRPQVNVLVSPQWLELRTTIITALDHHPQARESVLRAVDGAGSG
jgi:serine phosphatase RsbU (regulator of sigma subunit)